MVMEILAETLQSLLNQLDDWLDIRTEESLDIRQYVHARKIDTILLDYLEENVVVMERFVSADSEIGFVIANQTTFAICCRASLDCPSYGDAKHNAGSDSCYGTLGSLPAEMARILGVLDTLEDIEMLSVKSAKLRESLDVAWRNVGALHRARQIALASLT